MNIQNNRDQMTSELTRILAKYEVIPANFGWHIHQGDTYVGLLQYQELEGWQGNAFTYLPPEVKVQLKKVNQWNSSQFQLAA